MTLDLYDLCPGGTGKKIKHCKCRDILGDLNKAVRALQGGQRVAALDQINRLLITHANRPCLLALKSAALLGTQQLQELEETVATFLRVEPENAMALSYAAILNFVKHDTAAGVRYLQQAIEHMEEGIPQELFEGLGIAANCLIEEGEYVAARGHLLLQAAISANEEVASRVMQLNSNREVPASLKLDFRFAKCPGRPPWRAAFVKAFQMAQRGAWHAAGEQFERLAEQAPEEPAIFRNLAICRSFTADSRAAATWHQFAALPDLDWDEAIEAEALGLLMEGYLSQSTLPVVRITIPVDSVDPVMEKLLSSPVAVPESVDAIAAQQRDDSPPPKAAFALLTGEMPATGEPWTAETAPGVCGMVSVYGRQTDREARLEVLCIKGLDYERTVSQLRSVLQLPPTAELGDEQEEGSTTRLSDLCGLLHVPDGFPPSERDPLRRDWTMRRILDDWVVQPQADLDGKSPEQAAEDPAYRVRVGGRVLALWQLVENYTGPIDPVLLFRRLGLPAGEPIDPAGLELRDIPPVRRWRVDCSQMTDEQLEEWFLLSQAYGLQRSVVESAHEMLRRGSLGERIDREAFYGVLADHATTPGERVEALKQAAEEAEARQHSPARWLLKQLPLMLLTQDFDGFRAAVLQLQNRHWDEPGVAETVLELLQRIGLVGPDGRPTEQAAAATAQQQPAAAEPGKLWTPDQGAPSTSEPAETPSGQSKLWVPGGD